jgi:hypothetical protein
MHQPMAQWPLPEDEYKTGALHDKLDTSVTARQYDVEQLEEERDELLLMLANQVRISAKLAERAEHWHKQYWDLRKKHD